MSCCCAFTIITLSVLLAYLAKKVCGCFCRKSKVPNVDENRQWGPERTPTDDDVSINPFKINISDKVLDDLKQRLANSRPFTPPLEGIQHEYGFNTNLLKEIKEFWQTKYNWREREAFLNQIPQYTTKIQGLNIHFLHVKPTETNGLKVVPLILLHGWPSTTREFYETIPKLTTPQPGRNFVFEVVAPNLPGYGFSEGAVRPGLSTTYIAVIFKKLMERLQFDQWYVQGGDWGSDIGTQMAILYPKKVRGLHVNMAFPNSPMVMLKRLVGSFWPSLVVSEKHKSKMYPLKKVFMGLIRESGYFHIQATRPDTVGVGLNDSPIGLAAYILEKYIVWTNADNISSPDGGLALKFGYEKLLDNIMIHWINNSITTSMRIYSENVALTNEFKVMQKIPVEVPSAYAQFGNDVLYIPEMFLKEKFKNLLQYSDLPVGGHFASFEEPEVYADDVWNAVEKFEKYHKE